MWSLPGKRAGDLGKLLAEGSDTLLMSAWMQLCASGCLNGDNDGIPLMKLLQSITLITS